MPRPSVSTRSSGSTSCWRWAFTRERCRSAGGCTAATGASTRSCRHRCCRCRASTWRRSSPAGPPPRCRIDRRRSSTAFAPTAATPSTSSSRGGPAHRHRGIDLHRSVTLIPDDVAIVDGIPVTTVARTALDLAAVVRRRSVERALDQAEILKVFDLTALIDQLSRNPHHPGAPILKAILAEHTAGTTVTWSHLEELCLEVTRAAGVETPELSAYVDPGDGEPPPRCDFVWRAQRVIVEADGFGSHKSRQAFENDRRRDQRLIRVGWRVVRVTDRQLRSERARIAALIIDLLTRP